MSRTQFQQTPSSSRRSGWVFGLTLILAGVPAFAQDGTATMQGATVQGQSGTTQGTTPQGMTQPGTAAPGAAAPASGHWEGAIQLPQAELQIAVDLQQDASGTWKGSIDIPAQKAENLPLEPITVNGQTVNFAIKGLPGNPTFEGKLEGTEIKGTFTQAPPLPFSLARGADATATDASGAWKGAIQLPQGPLEVTINLAQTNGQWGGLIDIPAQQAQNLMLDPVAVDGQNVKFTIKGVPGNPTFTGTLAGNEIKGDFTQGAPTPFRLSRGTAQPATQQGQATPPQGH
ncbi:MAG TPA: hypothetical protein VJ725_25110 [Thermoanaerobaculia bacterium]|nr:hypothetical protein [Thermoanaerobaculia bacterium]